MKQGDAEHDRFNLNLCALAPAAGQPKLCHFVDSTTDRAQPTSSTEYTDLSDQIRLAIDKFDVRL